MSEQNKLLKHLMLVKLLTLIKLVLPLVLNVSYVVDLMYFSFFSRTATYDEHNQNDKDVH